MTILFQPLTPYHWLTTAIAALAAMIVLVGWWWGRLGRVRGLLTLLLSVAAFGLWTAAIWNPVQAIVNENRAPHLALVWDVSESAQRAAGGWPAVQRRTSDLLEPALANLPDDLLAEASASITTFQGNAVSETVPLRDLLGRWRALDDSDFAGGSGTNVAAGIDAGLDAIRRAGGRGEIALITDGHDTIGDARAAAERAAQVGVPVVVLPIDSREPAVAVQAIDLTTQTAAQSETILRGSIRNSSAEVAASTLRITQYVPDGAERGTQTSIPPLQPDAFARLRVPLLFEGVGLQPVDVRLDAGEIQHQRRLYTHVTRPVQIVAVGGDVRWMQTIPSDVATVTATSPDAVPQDLTPYDAVVLSATPRESFPDETLVALAVAVERDGLGLFLMNGDHGSADEQAESMLRSYHDTPIAPLLPVDTDPRSFQPEPPPRNVVFFIDTSGSMGGWPLNKAKEIARYIIENFLRPQDTLDVIAFTTGSALVVNQRSMDPIGQQEALQAVNRLQAGGGTDPRAALALIRDRRLENCGLIFLSDGQFSSGIAEARPDCRATAFGIGSGEFGPDAPIREIADPIAVSQTFNPAVIDIPYFEPEMREKFFERGGYDPLSFAFIDPSITLPVPDLRLQGSAVSFAREDAELIAVRPKFIDPLLAYRDAGQGRTGIFSTGFPAEWLSSEVGREAVQQYVLDVVGYAERERYLFEVADDGASYTIRLQVRSRDGNPPQLSQLTAQIALGQQRYPLTVRPVAGEVATYTATATIPRTDIAQPAQLILTEFGPDAASRPQRIPLAVPPAIAQTEADPTEANRFGTNTVLLTDIVTRTAGVYAPETLTLFAAQNDPLILRAYWPWLLAAGAVCYVLAIASQKI